MSAVGFRIFDKTLQIANIWLNGTANRDPDRRVTRLKSRRRGEQA
ncbi:hypothetical protein ABID19_005073 [Mesorhizobium robiniae]|uniref:Uncharacterized protein n=1 Tax=Mesorhizobium robiniae TaxID=559315 RepID=A0ABV2GUP2_9HYPH